MLVVVVFDGLEQAENNNKQIVRTDSINFFTFASTQSIFNCYKLCGKSTPRYRCCQQNKTGLDSSSDRKYY